MELTGRQRRALLLLGVLYAAVVVPIGIRKGSDLEWALGQTARLLAGQPLYEHQPVLGVWWPPFLILALLPFGLIAKLSLTAAKATYALVNVACLGWSLTRLPRTQPTHVALGLAAVAVPLQTNFEYLNFNAILLALVVATAGDLEAGREERAGLWAGLATAFKAFPGLLLIYFAYRRRWRALTVGLATTTAATLVAVLPYGPAAVGPVLRAWLDNILAGGWVTHGGNQSLPALVGRLGGSPTLALACELALIALTAFALRQPAPGASAADEVGITLLLAVLLSPIAWFHYYLLALPAWVTAVRYPFGNRAPWLRGMLVAAAVATSGVWTLWSHATKVWLLPHSPFVWGALALLLVLLLERLSAPRVAQPQPAL